jgi:archaellum component FlaC
MTGSALKAIKTIIENLTKDINKYLAAAQSYIDAVSSTVSSLKDIVANAACQIAKYMKIIFDKIFEYVLKKINKALAPTVDLLYPNQRHKYSDLKEIINQVLNAVYSKITNGLCGQIQGFLDKVLDKSTPREVDPDEEDPTIPTNGTTTTTPICSVEELSGNIIGQNMSEMNKSVDTILDNINNFLSDIQSELSEISGAINNVGSIIGGINGSITSALSFANILLNIFPSDLKPNCAVSDQYSIATGGGATEQPQLPRPAEVDKAAQKPAPSTATASVPFKEPSKAQADVDFSDKPSTAVERTQVGINQTPGFERF